MKQLLKLIKYVRINAEQIMFNLIIRRTFRKNITIISSNCIGTRLYQSARKEYTSPTVNLWINPTDFIKFTENLNFYLNENLTEFTDPEKNYPCAKLADIRIYFQHYKSFEDAKEKWEERKRRICMDNILVIFTDRDEATIQDIKRIAKQKNSIIFCSSDKKIYLESFPNIVFIDSSNKEVGDLYTNYHQMLYCFPFKKVFKI